VFCQLRFNVRTTEEAGHPSGGAFTLAPSWLIPIAINKDYIKCV
jgi:hypothetical protein